MSDFWQGFVLAIALLLVLERIRWAQRRIQAFGQPQVISQRTDRTPWQVLAGCLGGFWNILVWGAALATVIWAIVRFSEAG